MKVLIVSMSTLFIEALQIAIQDRRPVWQVETYQIQAPIFNQNLIRKIEEQCLDMVVVELTNQQFPMVIDSLKKLKNKELAIMFLVDSSIGEVYHHLKDEERWISVTKNTNLDECLLLVESIISNVLYLPDVSLEEMDRMILNELAIGQSFHYIQRTYGLSAEEIDQSLYRINTYFKVSNYIESVGKAFEQKVITH